MIHTDGKPTIANRPPLTYERLQARIAHRDKRIAETIEATRRELAELNAEAAIPCGSGSIVIGPGRTRGGLSHAA